MNLDHLQPIHDRVLIKRDDYADVSPAGVIKTHNPKAKRVFTGTVVACGPGHVTEKGVLIPMELKPGMRVLWEKYAGADFEMTQAELARDYVHCREHEVIALVVDEAQVSRVEAARRLVLDVIDDMETPDIRDRMTRIASSLRIVVEDIHDEVGARRTMPSDYIGEDAEDAVCLCGHAECDHGRYATKACLVCSCPHFEVKVDRGNNAEPLVRSA